MQLAAAERVVAGGCIFFRLTEEQHLEEADRLAFSHMIDLLCATKAPFFYAKDHSHRRICSFALQRPSRAPITLPMAYASPNKALTTLPDKYRLQVNSRKLACFNPLDGYGQPQQAPRWHEFRFKDTFSACSLYTIGAGSAAFLHELLVDHREIEAIIDHWRRNAGIAQQRLPWRAFYTIFDNVGDWWRREATSRVASQRF